MSQRFRELVLDIRSSLRHAPLFDQPHSLKLELPCKLPPLRDLAPVPSKHLIPILGETDSASQHRGSGRRKGNYLKQNSNFTFHRCPMADFDESTFPRVGITRCLRKPGAGQTTKTIASSASADTKSDNWGAGCPTQPLRADWFRI